MAAASPAIPGRNTSWRIRLLGRRGGLVARSGSWARGRSGRRGGGAGRAVLRDPLVDPFPPGVEPLELCLVAGRARYLVVRDPPPACLDDLVDREPRPDVTEACDVVQAGVGDEDDVGIGAGLDRGERATGAGRQQVGHLRRPFGQIFTA